MTDIEQMAREAGLDAYAYFGPWAHLKEQGAALERFAALIRAQERERCAMVCDELEDNEEEFPHGWSAVAFACADAIRALK